MENPMCASFKDYNDIPKAVPFDFIEDNVTWVSSKISVTSGALGAEAIDLRNWIIFFWCASE